MPSSHLPTQAVILAAGECSRFIPFQVRSRHKSMFSLMGKPIIAQTIQKLLKIGVHNIVVVHAGDDVQIQKELPQYVDKKIQLSFVQQDQALGMGHALASAAKQLNDIFLLVNTQQINIDDHLQAFVNAGQKLQGVTLFSQETDKPFQYGMMALKGNRVTKIIEKPTEKQLIGLSNQRILGIYILTKHFVEFMQTQPISDNLLEESLDAFAQKETVTAFQSSLPTVSLKYAWDLFDITHMLFGSSPEKVQINPKAQVHKTALISGQVYIEEGAKVYEYAIIQGPCYVGKNAVVGSYCKVRSETVLEEGVELQNNVEVKHSIIGKGTHIHSGFVGDSILGEDLRIGAGFITANKRLDRSTLKILVKGKKVDTKLGALGTIIGDNAKIGIHVGTNPGTIIEQDSIIYPMTLFSNTK